jgi:hypothetical protein
MERHLITAGAVLFVAFSLLAMFDGLYLHVWKKSCCAAAARWHGPQV